MKLMLNVALLIGIFAPLYGQQQLCFSNSCLQTPASSFALDRSNTQLNNIFRPLPALPAYTPVAPLALSPSGKQFFRYSTPSNGGNLLRLPRPSTATSMAGAASGDTAVTRSPANLNGSHTAGPTFSNGLGGISFSPTSPN